MMDVFFDTNVIIECLANRRQAASASKALSLVEQRKVNGCISAGTMYTLAYLMERYLKEQGQRNPGRLEELRASLTAIASMFVVLDMGSNDYVEAANNPAFKDLEDSFQYQMATLQGCGVLLTINTKDYKGAEGIEVLTPSQFLAKYNL